jgi:hypothetical protein
VIALTFPSHSTTKLQLPHSFVFAAFNKTLRANIEVCSKWRGVQERVFFAAAFYSALAIELLQAVICDGFVTN